MDTSMDIWVILFSVASTILAGFLTVFLYRRNQCGWGKTHASSREAFPAFKEKQETNISKKAPTGPVEPQDKSECTAQTNEDLPDETQAENCREVVEGECEQAGSEMDETSYSSSVNRMADVDQALKYMPGMLRTSQLEKMMSKEELEEEQRVQREQLAAIFRLLRENQDTFGEVTEKDMEEQLKLYSI